MIRIKIQKHFCYIISNNPQLAYAHHILHNAHKNGPMEATNTSLHHTHKSIQMNTLENYYIKFFHQHNIIIWNTPHPPQNKITN
jgi:hypothetical protein